MDRGRDEECPIVWYATDADSGIDAQVCMTVEDALELIADLKEQIAAHLQYLRNQDN